MNPQESMIAAEARIAEARALLAKPTPESVENCRTALSDAANLLEKLIVAGVAGWTPEFIGSLRQLQTAAQMLDGQVRHGSRFCMGWLQSRMGTGYTERGTPVMIEHAEGQTFEA